MSERVGWATLQIIPSAKDFGRRLSDEVDPHSRAAGRSSGGAFGGAMVAGVGKFAGPLAAVFAGVQVGGFLKDAIAQASDLSEAANKLTTVFGSATSSVMDFSKKGAKGLGQSTLAVQDAAATFGVYGKAAGLAGSANAQFSTELVQLSTDLASFYNTDPSQAMEAIASGLRGEAEPLRAYGVLLDDATLRQEALRLGLVKTTKNALTPQQRVLAAHAAIMKQTSVVQGDFAKTSGGLANQQRILSAQWDNLKSTIGAAFLPAVNGAMKGLNGLFDSADKVGPALQGLADLVIKGDFTGAFAQAFNVNEDAPIVDKILTIRETVIDTARQIVDGVKLFVGAFTGAGADVDMGKWTNPIINAGAALRDVWDKVGAAVLPILSNLGDVFASKILPALSQFGGYIAANVLPIITKLWSIFANNVLPILGTVGGFIAGWLVPTIVTLATNIGAKLKPVLDAVFSVIQERVMPAVQQLTAKFMEWWPTIQRVIQFVTVLAGNILEFAAAIVGKVLPPVIQFAGWLIGNLVGAIVTVIGWVIKIIGWIFDFGAGVKNAAVKVGEFVSGLISKFGEAVNWVKGLPGRILDALGKLGSTLWSAGTDLISGFINGLKAKAGDIIGVVKSAITDKLPQFVKDALGIKSPSRVFMALGRNVSEGMALGIEQRSGMVTKAVSALTEIPDAATANVGTVTSRSAASGGQGSPRISPAPVLLDGRQIAEVVFDYGGRDYGNGRKGY